MTKPQTTIYVGDCIKSLRSLRPNSVHCVVTSPPYWGLRAYGSDDQVEIGREPSLDDYVHRLVEVFNWVRRVLRPDGVMWINLGDAYAKSGGIKPGNLLGIPWKVAFALRDSGWVLRQDCIWHKPNPMPESVKNRCTKGHEYLFLLTKSPHYFYDWFAVSTESIAPGRIHKQSKKGLSVGSAIGLGVPLSGNALKEFVVNPDRANKRSVWSLDDERSLLNYLHQYHPDVLDSYLQGQNNKSDVWKQSTYPYKESHFAAFPPGLIEPCIRSGTSSHGCCSKCGSPWTRVLNQSRHSTREGNNTKATGDSIVEGGKDPQRHVTKTETIGWKPTCQHSNVSLSKCTVLDPFAGSGTTAVVSSKNNCDTILCEMYKNYCQMAIRRIRNEGNSKIILVTE